MRIIIEANYDEMSKKVSKLIAKHIFYKPRTVLGLATGETPLGMYKELVSLYDSDLIDFHDITTFNLDEYLGLDKDNPQSYNYYMHNNLFNHINIPKDNINIPLGLATDIAKEAIDYELKIRRIGGIDLQILGIGRNGHIGFNEPDIKFEALTHVVKLDNQTIEDNSRFFDSMDEVPNQAISMGIKTIMRAKKIILMASGIEKADTIRDSIYGNITPTLPASVLQLHPNVTYILDKAAASKLDLHKTNIDLL